MKHTLCFTLTAVISLLLIVAGTVLFGLPLLREIPSLSGMYVRAVVLSVEETADGTSGNTDTVFRALLKSGPDKGTARQNADKSISYETKTVAKNDTVILSSPEESGLDGWYFVEYVRSDYLIVLAVVFFAALLLFGRMKGLKSALSLLYTVAAIFLVFIPAVLTGQSIYLWTAILGVFITAMTLLLVNGWTELTLSSVLGCLSGISLSAVLIVISEAILHMSGYVDESSIYLSFLVPDMKGILYAAIIIGAIGAVMDVSMSIASSGVMEIEIMFLCVFIT